MTLKGVLEMPRTEDQSWQVTLRLPRDLEPAIREIARQRVVPPAIALRQIIKEYVDRMAVEPRRHEREEDR